MAQLRDQLQASLAGTYTLGRELGGGGMSRVFVAEDTALVRQVVVKVLSPELAATVNLDRFRREIQVAAQLQHPHIVPVLSAGVVSGGHFGTGHGGGVVGQGTEALPYYTMPYVDGESLR